MAHILARALGLPAVATRKSATAALSATNLFRQAALELVFPRTCVACQTELDSDDDSSSKLPLCHECLEQIEFLHGTTCQRCGAPVPDLTPQADDVAASRIK